ncbi:SPOR domain-containing protein [Pulveribacter sp.]|uniref:SPOR domain-containing protein n=1 Tax=Pulveribacter sp. TaxID=2678893 RepID=UPI00289D5766|nr:SPOR domain-containing protein [Pulveribacter sp.]
MPRMHASTAQAAYATHSGGAPGSMAAPTSMTVALYRAALGPLGSAEHYLAAFARMDATERVLPGWNGAAAFCTLGWMVLRRLWGELLAYLAGLLVLTLLLGALAAGGRALPAPVLAGLMLALVLLAFAVPGLYGDALVHRQVQRNIAAAVEAAPTMLEAMGLLERRAASRARLAAVATGCAALALLAAAVATLYLLGPQREQALRQTSAPPPVALPKADPRAAPSAAVDAPAAEKPVAEEEAAAEPALAAAPLEPAPQADALATRVPATAVEPFAAPTTADQPTQAAQSKPAPELVPPQAIKSPAKGPAKQSAEPARRLYINVGLFAEPANAQRTHARLLRAGLPSAVRQVTAADGRQLQRVRVGPFASSADANAAVARVRALGLDAVAAAEKPVE